MSTILAAGSNGRGQLATSNLDDAHEFTMSSFKDHPSTLPTGARKVLQVACGSNHTLLLLRLENGGTQLWGSGDGRRGQLGPTYFHETSSPKGQSTVFRQLDIAAWVDDLDLGGYSVRLVATSWETSYVVLSYPERDDILLSFGFNEFGNLGIGHSKPGEGGVHVVNLKQSDGAIDTNVGSLRIETLVASTHHVIVQISIRTIDGGQNTFILGWGASRHGQISTFTSHVRPPPNIPAPHIIHLESTVPVTSIASGFHHSVFLHSDGRLSALGSNKKNQLQNVDLLDDVKSVACTWNGTYVIVEKGGEWSIFATGSNSKGQLGHDPPVIGKEPGDHTLHSVTFPFAPSTRKLTKLVCGSEHVLCLFDVLEEIDLLNTTTPPTEIWGWGWNEHGNLGTGRTEDIHRPTRIWPSHDEGREGRVIDIWAGCGTSWLILEN